MVKKIPEDLQKFIDKYFNLEIKGEKVPCPYFMNSRMGFLKKSVFSGKADPYEIEATANETLANSSYVKDAAKLILEDLKANNIGVDCSGLIYQIYNKWLRDILNKGELKDFLPNELSPNIRRLISRRIKPESSVNADMFTSEPLAQKIDLVDVQPGDLIRTRGGKHVLFITEVEYDESNKPTKLKFVNSASLYHRDGVRYGVIKFNQDLNLISADWEDNDPSEPVNQAYKGYRELINKNGLFRPKWMQP